jgi:PIN domain nuclease of toxin-antitoxin system
MTPLLLDTCAAIWLLESAPLSPAAADALNEAFDNSIPLYISPITGWEIGLLSARGRIPLSMAPLKWFESLLAVPGVEMSELSPGILVASSFLPGMPPNDPADRIILATARDRGLRIMTRDKHLLKYADAGHVQAIAC